MRMIRKQADISDSHRLVLSKQNYAFQGYEPEELWSVALEILEMPDTKDPLSLIWLSDASSIDFFRNTETSYKFACSVFEERLQVEHPQMKMLKTDVYQFLTKITHSSPPTMTDVDIQIIYNLVSSQKRYIVRDVLPAISELVDFEPIWSLRQNASFQAMLENHGRALGVYDGQVENFRNEEARNWCVKQEQRILNWLLALSQKKPD